LTQLPTTAHSFGPYWPNCRPLLRYGQEPLGNLNTFTSSHLHRISTSIRPFHQTWHAVSSGTPVNRACAHCPPKHRTSVLPLVLSPAESVFLRGQETKTTNSTELQSTPVNSSQLHLTPPNSTKTNIFFPLVIPSFVPALRDHCPARTHPNLSEPQKLYFPSVGSGQVGKQMVNFFPVPASGRIRAHGNNQCQIFNFQFSIVLVATQNRTQPDPTGLNRT
jgi:hypothetical protein